MHIIETNLRFKLSTVVNYIPFTPNSITVNDEKIFCLDKQKAHQYKSNLYIYNWKLEPLNRIELDSFFDKLLILNNKFYLFGQFTQNDSNFNLLVRDNFYQNPNECKRFYLENLNTQSIEKLNESEFATSINDTIYKYNQNGKLIDKQELIDLPDKLSSDFKFILNNKDGMAFYSPTFLCYFNLKEN